MRAEELTGNELDLITTISSSARTSVFLVAEKGTQDFYILKKRHGSEMAEFYRRIQKLQAKVFPVIYRVWVEEDDTFILEEYISGETMQEILKKEEKLSENEMLGYMHALCEALCMLHRETPPIIHRDIKPENILITPTGELKLIDFDAAREYKEEQHSDTVLLGTREYAAPEQFGYAQTDARSDVYSMGIVFAELLAKSEASKRVSDKIQKVIERSTMFDPEKRYADAAGILKEMKNMSRRNYSLISFLGGAAIISVLVFIVLGSGHSKTESGKIKDSEVINEIAEITNSAEKTSDEALGEKLDNQTTPESEANQTIQMTETNWPKNVIQAEIPKYHSDEQLQNVYQYKSINEEFLKKDPVIGMLHPEVFDGGYGNQGHKEMYKPTSATEYRGRDYTQVFLRAFPRDIKFQSYNWESKPIRSVTLGKLIKAERSYFDSIDLREGQYIVEYENEVVLPTAFLNTLEPGEYLVSITNGDYEIASNILILGEEETEDKYFNLIFSKNMYYSSETKNDVYFYVNNTHFPIQKACLEGTELRSEEYDLTDGGFGIVLHADVLERFSENYSVTLVLTMGDETEATATVIYLKHYKGELQ